jgi:hypothetical protein
MIKSRRQRCLITAQSLLLLTLPVSCLGFDGRVSYPNGTPAAGAQVSVVLDDTSKKPSIPSVSRELPPQVIKIPADISRNASSTDGSLPAPPQGNPAPNAKSKRTLKCDSSGGFTFPGQAPTGAMIQIKAPDGKDFATVTLPAKLFVKGELAIVLQPK